MSVYVVPLFGLVELEGTLSVAYRCSCGFDTHSYDVRPDRGGDEALEVIRTHLVDAHGAELGMGRCQRCQIPTNAFRAHMPELGQDVFLCERHAPKIPVVVDQADAGDAPRFEVR